MKVVKKTYQDIVQSFSEENCKLLTTEDEYNTMKIQKINLPKYTYIASCGHQHTVFYNVFLNRKTGVICPNCVIQRNAKIKKEKMSTNKLKNIKQEFHCINFFIDLVKEQFTIIKAFDGCLVDIIMKPNDMIEDKWIGIQVKTCEKGTKDYGFQLNNDYTDCLLLCICKNDKRTWMVPFIELSCKKKLTIGVSKSKYNNYEVTNDSIFDRLHQYYQNMTQKTFDEWDTPINEYQIREKEFRVFREMKIDFIPFTNHSMESLVYDFKIGDLKIQEKVGSIRKNRKNTFSFCICKNNGKTNNKRKQIQYEIGDNDFYWFHFSDKKYFLVIPEKELIDKEYIGNKINKKILNINLLSILTDHSHWLYPYFFEYNNIDKIRLRSLFPIENI